MSRDGAPGEPLGTDAAPRRGFGLATATFVVVASMVGTGVLTTSGFTVLSTRSNALMLALWVVGGLVALCGALCVAELSAMLPKSGGDYVFLYEAYGPLVAFLTGWVSFLIGFGGPIALSASGSAKYLLAPLGLSGEVALAGLTFSKPVLAQRALATALILGLGVIHSSGARRSAWAQGTMTALKYGILAAIAAVGLVAARGRLANLADVPPVGRWDWSGMFFSLVFISYAFTGWNSAGYIAGEVEDPRRLVPRAILTGTGLVLALYLALNVFYAAAIPAPALLARVEARQAEERERLVAEGVAEPEADERAGGLARDSVAPIAQIAASGVLGPRVADGLSVAIGLSLLASASAFVLTGPRVAFAMARAGQFPALAGRLSARTGAPAVATALQVGWSLVLLWTGTFEGILLYSSVGLAILSMLNVASIYVLRWRKPGLPRPFRTPGYPLTPAVYLVLTALLTAAAFDRSRAESLWALGSILAGIPVYFLLPRRATAGPPSESR
jgi:APA family basic amino acid/polyamine antiporter